MKAARTQRGRVLGSASGPTLVLEQGAGSGARGAPRSLVRASPPPFGVAGSTLCPPPAEHNQRTGLPRAGGLRAATSHLEREAESSLWNGCGHRLRRAFPWDASGPAGVRGCARAGRATGRSPRTWSWRPSGRSDPGTTSRGRLMTGPAVVWGVGGTRQQEERNSEAFPLILEEGRGVTQRPRGLQS